MDFIANSLYIRLSIEIWLIALCVYSMRTIFRKVPSFGHGLLAALVSMTATTAVTYFLDLDIARFITAITFTPALGLFGILWMVALLRHASIDEGREVKRSKDEQ